MLTWSRWKLAAELQGVVADDMGEIVAPLEGVVDLALSGDIDADGEIVEGDILNALNAVGQRNDAAACLSPSTNPCEARIGPTPPYRLADDVGVAHVAEVRLVHRVGAEGSW